MENPVEPCAICHEPLEKSTATIECGHTFHYSCIFQWHQSHETCPLCRNVEEVVADVSSKRETEYLDHLGEILDNQELSVVCRFCNIEAYRCPDCYKPMCHCSETNEYFYGKNPFSRENYVESCIHCFETRDEYLLKLINEFIKTLDFDDIFETFEIDELFEKYYFNNNNNGENIEGFRSFKDYEDFKSHARYIYELSIYGER